MEVIISKQAQRQCARLPKSEQVKIKKKINMLEENPLVGKKLSGDLEGRRSLRAWPYRIIYTINMRERKVGVSSIVHRQALTVK